VAQRTRKSRKKKKKGKKKRFGGRSVLFIQKGQWTERK
jgi:hypothetical protein